jgi:pyruvate dehydrogenase E1 component alpha subunit
MPRTTVAEFGVDSVEVLAADGSVDEELAPSLSPDRLRELYRLMRASRRLDERAIALQRRGELGTYAPAIGQEAAQVGSAVALAERDWMIPAFREQAAYLARGVQPQRLLEYAMGMEEGSEITPGGRNFPPAIPVGSQTLHAAGVGWGNAVRDVDEVALAYFGDGATSTGDFYEALNMAGTYRAQTVFFCQNNQYAISTPRERQTRAQTLAQKAIAAGIEGVQVDGNDVLGTYAVTRDAVERARDGRPVLIEALTYRRSMHTTSDDPRVYRTEDEEREWEARDPVVRFEAYLRDRGILDDDAVAEIETEIERELAEAIDGAKAALAGIDRADMFRYAYAEQPPEVTRQLAAFEAERGPPPGETDGGVADTGWSVADPERDVSHEDGSGGSTDGE